MENKLIHSAAVTLADKLNRYLRREGLELKKIVLGIEILIINITKFIIIYVLAIILGVVSQTLIVHTAFLLIKRYSFGLHALNSTVCTVVSCFMFVAVPLLLSEQGIGNYVVIVTFAGVIFILYRYAPADTKARPLLGKQIRMQLKVKAVTCGVILMAIALLVSSPSTKLLLALGAVYQSISILPTTYKLLKRSVKNYERYECA